MERLYILIDDDQLIRMTWEFKAKSSGVKIKVFASPDEFFNCSDTLPKDSFIYIDSDLGNGVLGEEVAKDIYAQGFIDIFLSTGKEADQLDYDKSIIKGIGGKEPPF